MTPQAFVKKWAQSTLTERSASQSHFNDVCALIGHPTPADADPHGTEFCFDKGAKKVGGGDGWADVWKRGCFAWEYKGKDKSLPAALTQLKHYALALENPPLLIVSDMEIIQIHTNFTNTVYEVYTIPLAEIAQPENLQRLRWLFTDPERLRPGITTLKITEEAASNFARIAQSLRDRKYDPQRVAHFLNKLLFSFFAEDVGLLPPRLMHRLFDGATKHPEKFEGMLKSLFGAMTSGGPFGAEVIDWFNGGLFDGDDALVLTEQEIKLLRQVALLDWSNIEPSIFGTLFERGLDPSKRSQLGAHYTDAASIMRLVRPTIEEPLLAEWAEVKKEIAARIEKLHAAKGGKKQHDNLRREAEQPLVQFLQRLKNFRVLDPACGSGNFLYLALQALKDIEHRVNLEAEELGLEPHFPEVDPSCVYGIELNSYAAELARVTIWIGEIQWMLAHGYQPSKQPILKKLNQIECKDAVMNENGSEPVWPEVDVIVGNPPFLGDKKLNAGLGKSYATKLRRLYKGRVPGGADLVCYWFEKARAALESGAVARAGLVATNSIRGGANRKVLQRVLETKRTAGDPPTEAENLVIYDAWSDEPWVNEGAAVRVSLVSFAPPSAYMPRETRIDGKPVGLIHADLTASSSGGSQGANVTLAEPLAENKAIAFSGITKKGKFELEGDAARAMLLEPLNPNGRPNSDVVRPWKNGDAITGRDPDRWIVHFGELPEEQAALYASPFSHVAQSVRPARSESNSPAERRLWWLLARRAPDLFSAIQGFTRFIVTPEVSKHRVFVWLDAAVIPDKNLVAIARDDDMALGVLQSRHHALWALRLGTSLEDRPRYTSSTTFRTFPFPDGLTPNIPASKVANVDRAVRIAEAAKQLDSLRAKWLNPPELVKQIPEVAPGLPDRLVPVDDKAAAELKKRTLTALYNASPAWLVNAHRHLDKAVAAAYGWTDYTPEMPDEEILRRLLRLNRERTSALAKPLKG